jgi:hypothetical protein
MWQIKKGPVHFRCHTGHSLTPLNMLFEHREKTERTLGVLMTLFEDEVTLTKKVLEANYGLKIAEDMTANLKRSEKRAIDLRKLLPGGYRPAC